jgi:Flp pilus assembly protein TadG
LSTADGRRQAGQSLVELAVAAPVLVVLLTGVVNIGIFVSDKVMAGYAARSGARLAAVLGSGNGLTTSQIDQQVVQGVLASAANLTFATITEIDIYSPTAASGAFNSSTDPYDSYNGSGSVTHTGFANTSRNQTPPNETSIGVRVKWTYAPPTGSANQINLQTSEYTVMKAAPLLPQ